MWVHFWELRLLRLLSGIVFVFRGACIDSAESGAQAVL